MRSLLSIATILIVGCNSNSSIQEGNNITCLQVADSISANHHLKYFSKKDKIAIEVRIGDILDTMDTYLDCNTNTGLTPKLIAVKDSMLLLAQGSGFHYRNMIVCKAGDNQINFYSFETNRADPDAPDYFVYKNPSKPHEIITFDRLNGSEANYPIDLKYQLDTIKESLLYKDSIVIIFADSKEWSFPLRNK